MLKELSQQGLLAFTLDISNAKKKGSFSLTKDCQLQLLDEGVWYFEPSALVNSQHAVVLSAGIHGNETAPIEWLDRFVQSILNNDLILKHPLLVILGHPPAMRLAKREVTFNLNRLFNHKHLDYPDTYESQRAADLEAYVADFFSTYPQLMPIHLDLHTAIRASKYPKFAVYPFQHGKPWRLDHLALMQACGVNCILLSHQATATFSYHSAKWHKALAFTVELGKVHAFGANDLSQLQALDDCIKNLLSEPLWPSLKLDWSSLRCFKVEDEIIKEADDFHFDFADSLANFSEFTEGERLATQANKEHYVNNGIRAVVFPNAKVALGQRAALIVERLSFEQIQDFQRQSCLV